METEPLKKAVLFLRRRQRFLEGRTQLPGPKSYDVKEAIALDCVLTLCEDAIRIAEER